MSISSRAPQGFSSESQVKPARRVASEKRVATQKRGRDGEDIASAFLVCKGAHLIARNWQPKGAGVRGEIDIIAQVSEFLCFIEVKTRASEVWGEPQDAVGAAKQRQISRLANAYLSREGVQSAEQPCRFDVIEVWLLPNQKPRIEWIENAFDYQG